MSRTHVEGSDHAWEGVQRGNKDFADDHEVPSPFTLYPSHIHCQGKKIRYLQLSSSNPPCLLFVLWFTL